MLPGRDLPPKATAATKGTAAPKGKAAPKGVAWSPAPPQPLGERPPGERAPVPRAVRAAPVEVEASPPVEVEPVVVTASTGRPRQVRQPAPVKSPQVQIRAAGCLRVLVSGFALLIGLGVLGSISDLISDEDEPDAQPAAPFVSGDVTGASGDTLVVGGRAVTVTASFALTVPELGSDGYLVVDTRLDGSPGPSGFTLIAPDGSTLPDPYVQQPGRLVWEIGDRRGEFSVVWESPETIDDTTGTWRVILL